MGVCVNRTIVTSQMNHHMIWFGWQEGQQHLSEFSTKNRRPDVYKKREFCITFLSNVDTLGCESKAL